MAMFGEDRENLRCSFCGKRREQVANLIAGAGVTICNECVELCNDILHKEEHPEPEEFDGVPLGKMKSLPKPREPPVTIAVLPDKSNKSLIFFAINFINDERCEKRGRNFLSTDEHEENGKWKTENGKRKV